MQRVLAYIIAGAAILALALIAFSVLALAFQSCWNGVHGLHTLFGTTEISFDTAFSGVIATAILGTAWGIGSR